MRYSTTSFLLAVAALSAPLLSSWTLLPVVSAARRPSGGGSRPSPSYSSPSKAKSASTAITDGLKNTLASGLAAACSKTILAPFDTIKTVQQHVEGGKSLGLLEAGRRITARPGGALNLYAGLGVAALGSMPSVGLYFGVYSYCKRMIGPRLYGSLGSEREDGKEALCSDGVLKTITIMCSAAIGAFNAIYFYIMRSH